MIQSSSFRDLASLVLLLVVTASPAWAQDEKKEEELTLKIDSQEVKLEVGESKQLTAKIVNKKGEPVEKPILFYSFSRRTVSTTSDGKLTGIRPGRATVVIRTNAKSLSQRLQTRITVTVVPTPVASVKMHEFDGAAYVGIPLQLKAAAFDRNGKERKDVEVSIQVKSGPGAIDAFGALTARGPGAIVLVSEAEGFSSESTVTAVANPVAMVKLTVDNAEARTGDVLHFKAVAQDNDGKAVSDAAVQFSFMAKPEDHRGPHASGQIRDDGRFVAELPGIYTIMATCGDRVARVSVKIGPRNVSRRIRLLGHGPVRDVHTSDLWVWEGLDGRDYAVTGTWGGNGEAIFWDVTDPKNLKRIDTVKVDARTVNDVKVSADGRTCVISREGASNRKNGIVILDVSDPTDVKVLSEFNDDLTGGVHNVFIYKNHVYAVNNGRRYDIIDIYDPLKPKRVGRFELDSPGHSIHDVWIEDGIAYSSNWRDGVQLVDVGNGKYGGSPSNPVQFGSYAYPSGWNHAAFPFKSKSTGKFYVLAGDEAFPNGLQVKDKPTIPAGWIHIMEFDDPKNPVEIARYEVPNAGTHNFWIEDDLLYIAYYNAGLRVVDISGELMGDLFRQGREVAHYVPTDHKGYVANAAMTWGPQPHKGTIFLSDWNSGLWAVELAPPRTRRGSN